MGITQELIPVELIERQGIMPVEKTKDNVRKIEHLLQEIYSLLPRR